MSVPSWCCVVMYLNWVGFFPKPFQLNTEHCAKLGDKPDEKSDCAEQSTSWESWAICPADGMRNLPLFARDESF